MRGVRGAKKRLWRWRRNPLRRHVDVVEAWTVLLMWVVVLVGGVATALVTTHSADEVFARQRTGRHAVRAVLLADVRLQSTSVTQGTYRGSAQIRWTAPDGTARTGRTPVTSNLRAGSGITVWQDGHGTLAPKPATRSQAAVEAAFFGAAAGLGFAGAVFGAGRLARWRLDRRRLGLWAEEWERVGPRWDQKTG